MLDVLGEVLEVGVLTLVFAVPFADVLLYIAPVSVETVCARCCARSGRPGSIEGCCCSCSVASSSSIAFSRLIA